MKDRVDRLREIESIDILNNEDFTEIKPTDPLR
jgi:hypothetical protein